MKIRIYFLLAIIVIIFTSSCGAGSLKVSQISEACAKLPDSRQGASKEALEKITFDGYLTKNARPVGATNGGYPWDVEIKDTDNDETITVRFYEGDGNNELRFVGDAEGYIKIKSSSGEVIKTGDKMRILAQWANTKGDRRYTYPCTIIPLRIDKQ